MFLESLFLRFELTVFFYDGDFVFFLQGTWSHYYLKQSVLKKVSIISDLHNCCSNFVINFLKFLTQVPQVLTFSTLVYYFLSTCISKFFMNHLKGCCMYDAFVLHTWMCVPWKPKPFSYKNVSLIKIRKLMPIHCCYLIYRSYSFVNYPIMSSVKKRKCSSMMCDI